MSSTTEATSAPTFATVQSSVPPRTCAASSSSGVMRFFATKTWYAETPSIGVQVKAMPFELCLCGTRTTLSGMPDPYHRSTPRARHPLLDLFQLSGKIGGHQFPLSVRQHQHFVLDANPEAALGQVDARLHREDRAGGDGLVARARV